MEDIPARLAIIKAHFGLGVNDLAFIWGVTYNQALNYMSGRTKLPNAKLMKVSEKLKIDPIWILTGEGMPPNVNVLKDGQAEYKTLKAGYEQDHQERIKRLLLDEPERIPFGEYDVYEIVAGRVYMVIVNKP